MINYQKSKGSLNKSKLDKKKYKIEKFIMNFCNGKLPGAMVWSLTPLSTLSSSPNSTLSKLIGTLPKTSTKWD